MIMAFISHTKKNDNLDMCIYGFMDIWMLLLYNNDNKKKKLSTNKCNSDIECHHIFILYEEGIVPFQTRPSAIHPGNNKYIHGHRIGYFSLLLLGIHNESEFQSIVDLVVVVFPEYDR